MNELGDAFAAALKRMLKLKKLTVDEAARRLGVSRQAFHAYLNGKLPRRKRLNKAMQLFELRLDLGQNSFYKEAFGRPLERKIATEPTQLKLLELLDSVSEDDLQVTIKRMGKTLRVQVRIEIPA
ncbi:MAG TPA: helix-turn-helix domain-containing protein [Candidatus Sulfotelmatobacter sp.]|nr:helix-turn-helix domain-containing protein [Candidatus Sulfotelmatobacter sp.]